MGLSGSANLAIVQSSFVRTRYLPGVIGTSGEVWKQQRRFTLRSLKDLGFGKNSLEPIMQQELEELLDIFTQKAKEKFEVGVSGLPHWKCLTTPLGAFDCPTGRF